MVVRYAVSVTAGVGAVSDYLREETVAERKSRLVDSDRPAIETASGRWSVEGMAFSADTKHAAYERAGGRYKCLRQSCAAHYAGGCGRPLTGGWHAH